VKHFFNEKAKKNQTKLNYYDFLFFRFLWSKQKNENIMNKTIFLGVLQVVQFLKEFCSFQREEEENNRKKRHTHREKGRELNQW